MRGEYALAYDDQLGVELTTGGTTRQKSAAETDKVNLGGTLVLDLAELCARAVCPAEIFGAHLSVDQVEPDIEHPQHVISLDGHAGLVDHTRGDELSATIAGAACSPLVVVTGRFTHRGETVMQEPSWSDADGGACDPLDGGTCTLSAGVTNWPGDAPVDGLAHGRAAAFYPASCGLPGVDGTLHLSIGFSGTRLGAPQLFDAAVPATD